MTRQRQDRIAKSIVYAILFGSGEKLHERTSFLSRFFALLTAFFTLFQLNLIRVRNDLFSSLRTTSWSLPDDDYFASFEGAAPSSVLSSTKDMGFSGSTFFTTSDSKYIIKSVPRHFEHSFFRDEFLVPYAEHMKQYPGSLLVRITDFLAVRSQSLGGWLGLAPTHHIVMANLLSGQAEAEVEEAEEDEYQDEDGNAEGGKTGKWETYDLKPTSYFVPERDIAGGALTSEATKARLTDQFDGKLNLQKEEAEELMKQLHRDTDVLREANAVDYSLFLIRIPLLEPGRNGAGTAVAAERTDSQDATDTKPPPPPRDPPFTPPSPPSWLTGVPSADGKYVYRMCVLDFFWGRHKPHAKLMGLLIRAWNVLVDRSAGEMSITTTAEDYKERFMELCEGLVEVVGGD